jgi:hypothetical protein
MMLSSFHTFTYISLHTNGWHSRYSPLATLKVRAHEQTKQQALPIKLLKYGHGSH